MRHKPTIVLALVATVLGSLALMHTGSKYRNKIFGVPAITPGKHLFKVRELDDTRYIELTTSQGVTAKFSIEDNHWVADSPWKDRADPLFIRTLFQFTAGLKVQEVIPRKGLELEKFGIRKGNIRIKMLDAKRNKIVDYYLGRQAAWHVPTDDGKKTLTTNFIRLHGRILKDNIYLCSTEVGQIHGLFNNDFARFRDHHPFYFSHQFLDKVRVQNTEGEVVISRDSLRSPWSITKPLTLQVDPKALSELFTNLIRLTAIKVEDRANVTLPTAETNSAHSREIALHSLGMKEDFTLRIYPPAKEGDSVALATMSDRPHTVFYLPITSSDPNIITLSQLQTSVNDLRSKTMTHLNGPQLARIIIRPTGRPPTLLSRTKKTTWRVLREKGYEVANENAIIDLMTAVTRDKIEKFVTDAATDLSPYGLDQPFLQLGFVSFNHDGMRLAIGRPRKGDAVYARIVGKPNVWKISQETLSKIAIHPWQWRTSHVWHIPKIDIEHITIERKGEPTVGLEYAFFSEKWKATRGIGDQLKDATADLNPNRANTLLGHLESLTTTKWIGPTQPMAQKALENPDIIIKIRIKQIDDDGNDTTPITKTLKIANTAGKLIYFAKLDTTPRDPKSKDEDSYFLLDPETVSHLQVDLFE